MLYLGLWITTVTISKFTNNNYLIELKPYTYLVQRLCLVCGSNVDK